MRIITKTFVDLAETRRVKYLKKSFLEVFDWKQEVSSKHLGDDITIVTDRKINNISIYNPFTKELKKLKY